MSIKLTLVLEITDRGAEKGFAKVKPVVSFEDNVNRLALAVISGKVPLADIVVTAAKGETIEQNPPPSDAASQKGGAWVAFQYAVYAVLAQHLVHGIRYAISKDAKTRITLYRELNAEALLATDEITGKQLAGVLGGYGIDVNMEFSAVGSEDEHGKFVVVMISRSYQAVLATFHDLTGVW